MSDIQPTPAPAPAPISAQQYPPPAVPPAAPPFAPIPAAYTQPGGYLPVPAHQPPVGYHAGPGYPGGYPQPQIAPKSPGVALLCSFLLPGLGSMMNGETGKGVGILIGWFVSLLLTAVFIGIFGVIGFWIWGMVDAHQGAVRWNAARGIVS